MVSVNAHGLDVTNATAIVIADNSTGILAKTVAIEMGVNVSVYKYNSEALVQDELELAISNPYKKILAVSYPDTVKKFIKEHPEASNRIFILCDANENSIRQDLTN